MSYLGELLSRYRHFTLFVHIAAECSCFTSSSSYLMTDSSKQARSVNGCPKTNHFVQSRMKLAISKTGNGESGNGNGERGMGMGNLLKGGISKRGNLLKRGISKTGNLLKRGIY